MNEQGSEAATTETPAEPYPGFTPQPMVRWLSPSLLVKAGLEVVVSGLFARFADKRDVEAWPPISRRRRGGDPEHLPVDDFDTKELWAKNGRYAQVGRRDKEDNLWFDYVSDVGEGFHPTYTIAWLLAQPDLEFSRNKIPYPTRRGALLIFGGDQVYPAAKWEEYRDRYVGPYRAAFPRVAEDEEAPDAYAIPGNHDWYDGLTSFLRVFCQGGWVGAWRTRQRRSYFALRLAEDWWLWATDTQFDSYLDGPQLDYFQAASTRLKRGHRVILATAKPSWVTAERHAEARIMDADSWQTLSYVEEELIAKRGAEVAVTITGDKHHYARYTRQEGERGPTHRLTAGGGGAHTSATHDLPGELRLRPHGSDHDVVYTQRKISPSPDESLKMRSDGLRGLVREHALGAVIGGIYALLAVLVVTAMKQGEGVWEFEPLDGHWIWVIGAVALLYYGLRAFVDAEQPREGPDSDPADAKKVKKRKKRRFGAAHTAAHVVPALIVAFVVILLLNGTWVDNDGFLFGGIAFVAALAALGAGFVWGRVAFGLYLLAANKQDGRQHATEIYGGLASTEYKNFLRFRLSRKGELMIYPIGVKESPSWTLSPTGSGRAGSWYKPDSEPEADLIDDVIKIPERP